MNPRLSRYALASAFLLICQVSLKSEETPQKFKEVQELKEEALSEFKAGNYEQAIHNLKQALKSAPRDAEIYYMLGYFNHYLCYDSMPLTGFTRKNSDETINYLQKAVEIDPDYGDAYYFLGAEYGARARDEMQRGNAEGVRKQFGLGKEAGGYPHWMLEYGRNTLRSCDRDAILIMGGDAETNPIEYLQCIEAYRTDVTAIPFALLNHPWFVSLLKKGMDGIIREVQINLTDQQIASMHPYKWKKNKITIPVSNNLRKRYGMKEQKMEWEITPDLKAGERELLSTEIAILVTIIKSNEWKRPVYFSLTCPSGITNGIETNLQLTGLCRHLLPCKAEPGVDTAVTSSILLNEEAYRSISTLGKSDMPRVSRMLENYRASLLMLANSLVRTGELQSAKKVIAFMKEKLPPDLMPIREDIKRYLKTLEENLNEDRK